MSDVPSQLRVLVIDDDVDNAEALCALLEVMGCQTTVAFGGKEGVAASWGFAAHVAFIDLEMPGMDGCEVVRQIHARDPGGSTKLICLTGRGHPEDRRHCLECGFDDFFTKPLAEESLASVLAEANAAL